MKTTLCIATAISLLMGVQAAETETQIEMETEIGTEIEHAEIGLIGVGYQGFFIGGDLLNTLAVRYAPKPIGGQVEIGKMSIDADGDELDLFMLKGKGYYSLIERENSTFYAGASLAYIKIEQDGTEVDGFSIAPLMGVEYKLQGLPELGLNFEVSYEIVDLDADGADVTLDGIGVCAGMSYYF